MCLAWAIRKVLYASTGLFFPRVINCSSMCVCVCVTLEEVVFCVLVWVVRTPNDVERRPARHHLEHQHAQGPPVHTEPWRDTHIVHCFSDKKARDMEEGSFKTQTQMIQNYHLISLVEQTEQGTKRIFTAMLWTFKQNFQHLYLESLLMTAQNMTHMDEVW